MILIKKNETQACKRVLQYEVSSKEEYRDISSKDKEIIKDSLLKEQGYLCAYCMKRLDNTNYVKIEHIAPQSVYPEKSLSYRNMLAVCDGMKVIHIHSKHVIHIKGILKLKQILLNHLLLKQYITAIVERFILQTVESMMI